MHLHGKTRTKNDDDRFTDDAKILKARFVLDIKLNFINVPTTNLEEEACRAVESACSFHEEPSFADEVPDLLLIILEEYYLHQYRNMHFYNTSGCMD